MFWFSAQQLLFLSGSPYINPMQTTIPTTMRPIEMNLSAFWHLVCQGYILLMWKNRPIRMPVRNPPIWLVKSTLLLTTMGMMLMPRISRYSRQMRMRRVRRGLQSLYSYRKQSLSAKMTNRNALAVVDTDVGIQIQLRKNENMPARISEITYLTLPQYHSTKYPQIWSPITLRTKCAILLWKKKLTGTLQNSYPYLILGQYLFCSWNMEQFQVSLFWNGFVQLQISRIMKQMMKISVSTNVRVLSAKWGTNIVWRGGLANFRNQYGRGRESSTLYPPAVCYYNGLSLCWLPVSLALCYFYPSCFCKLFSQVCQAEFSCSAIEFSAACSNPWELLFYFTFLFFFKTLDILNFVQYISVLHSYLSIEQGLLQQYEGSPPNWPNAMMGQLQFTLQWAKYYFFLNFINREEYTIMKVQSVGLEAKDPRTLGPIIERIIYFHDKNQQKQLKAQSATHSLTLNYEKSKKRYQEKVKQKQTEIIKRLEEIKKARAIIFKKQSQHIQKVLAKSSNDNQIRRMNKLEKINQRNIQHEKNKNDIMAAHRFQTTDFFNLTQHPESHSRTVSNSLNVDDIKFNKYKKIHDLCEQIRKKSEQKQQKAGSNRRMFQDRNRIKELNQNKIQRKIRAEEQFLIKENSLIKKSVWKLELSEKRSEEHSKSQRKKSQQKKDKDNKSLQKIRKNRSDLELKLEQKLATLEKLKSQKQKKSEQNKQNLVQSWVSNKKNARLQKADQTLTRFHQSMEQFNTKMNDMYRKDREQWGFLTKVNQFKEILIEKNVYENNQLCLQKG